jgi:hypothetical protein
VVPRGGFPAGVVGYGLAWAAVLTLGAATAAFLLGTPDRAPTLKAAFTVAGVLTVAGLHLAAVSIERRRRLGLAAVTVALSVVLVPALSLGLLSVATGWGPGGALTGGPATAPAAPGDGTGEVLPDGAEDGLPADGGTVWCQAADGSMMSVDAASCVGGRIAPGAEGASRGADGASPGVG